MNFNSPHNKLDVDYYAIDYALFNQEASRVLPKAIFVEYDSTKRALLDIVKDHYTAYAIENMMIKSDKYDDVHDIGIEESSLMHKTLARFTKMDPQILQENAKVLCKNFLENGMDLDAAVHVSTEAAYAKLLITDMLIKPVLYESSIPDIVDEQSKSLLASTFKILLNDLIETALPYMNAFECNCA